ncbi:hypothetical protein B296_00000849 [Ensete ventricosum]|uniref:NADP-dependent oxidoreductase domain-containing protein n=1 Tax=Ensete ventricosum TaxID=4639 RepID=A0A427AN70_ENSVE|nr:hypothetical protein B296_00000849 [Ensete ventricosum]
MQQVMLSSGRRMPVLGMGTATYPVPPDEIMTSAVIDAIELGYRHFDTASVYGSERAVGQAIAAALERGLIRSRDELFVTTKLWCTDMHADGVVPALQESLRTLGLEYIDLYLIHYPVRLKGDKQMVFTSEDMIPLDMPTVWEAMEKCQGLGLAKSIGVSNFTCRKLADLLSHAKIPPAVNQLESFGVVMQCWNVKRSKELLSLWEKAEPRWGVEQGGSIVVKSFNKERLKENMEIFDWNLKEEDKERLSLVPQKRLILVHPFISPNGFYKSHADFWDGDV